MSLRRLTAGGVFVLMNLLGAAAAFAQPHPFDMFSGVRGLNGPGTASLVTSNASHFSILTDVQFSANFSPGDVAEVTLVIEGVSTGQKVREIQVINLPADAPVQTVPMSLHLTTGILFLAGDEIKARVEGIPANRTWLVNFSGYFYEIPPTGIAGQSPSATPSHLGQNAPNPFNPSTNITYSLATAGEIRLRFFDSQGRMVRTLVDGRKDAGEHTVTWDGRNDSGQALPSGVYYYEMAGNVPKESRKAILLK